MAWLSGWSHRFKFIVKSTSQIGTVTDYQLLIDVSRDGDSLRRSITCYGLCKEDYSDIRFTKADGVTLIPYFIEDIIEGRAIIWVKFDEITVDGSTFYMYFGNQYAQSISNGYDTFYIFDDFDGSSLNQLIWNVSGSGNISVDNSKLTLHSVSGDLTIKTNSVFHYNYAFKAKVFPYTMNGGEKLTFGLNSPNSSISFGFSNPNTTYRYKYYTIYGSTTTVNMAEVLGATWIDCDIHLISSSMVRFYLRSINRFHRDYITSNIYSNNNLSAYFQVASNGKVDVDWVFVRKHYDNGPYIAGFGNLESTTQPNIWYSNYARRYLLYISPLDVNESLVNFPVAIKLSGSSGKNLYDTSKVFDHVGSDYSKIAITDEFGNLLSTEVSLWDHVNKLGVLYTKVPHVSGIDTTKLYLYFDASAQANQLIGAVGSDVGNSVWDNYLCVYHLANDLTVAVKDSKKLNNLSLSGQCVIENTNLDKGIKFSSGGNATIVVHTDLKDYSYNNFQINQSGTIRVFTYGGPYNLGAAYFNGSAYMHVAPNQLFNLYNKDFTIEAWFSLDSQPGYDSNRPIFNAMENSNNRWTMTYVNQANVYKIRFEAVNGGVSQILENVTKTLSNGYMYHVAVTKSGSTLKIWLDGEAIHTATVSPMANHGNNLTLYIGDLLGQKHVGYISMARISTTVRYSSNFTPPRYWLKPDSDTVFLGLFRPESPKFLRSFEGSFEAFFRITNAPTSGTPAIVGAPTASVDYLRYGIISYTNLDVSCALRLSNTSTLYEVKESGINTSNWYHYSASFDVFNYLLDVVRNGSFLNSTQLPFGTTSIDVLGSNPMLSKFYSYTVNSIIDEVRVSRSKLSTNWRASTYRTLIDSFASYVYQTYSDVFSSVKRLNFKCPVIKEIPSNE